MQHIKARPRRNRRSQNLRDSLAETQLNLQNLVYPLFLHEGVTPHVPITSMPGIGRFSLDAVLSEVESCLKLGISSFALFAAVPERKKNPAATEALNPEGLLPQSIQRIKSAFPEVVLYSDVALDPFNSDGHDGLVQNGKILNDATIAILAKMAVLHAQAGVDFVAPSDMMDGRVGALRRSMDEAGFTDTGIMSYAAKYASSFYGPFREALDSAPKAGDKKTYQMDFRNSKEALYEAQLDLDEGADIVMVKPALLYLDVIQKISQDLPLPVAAYFVSGEYSMIKLAAKQNFLNESAAILESLTAIRRAGAQLIFTYFAKEAAKILK
jgi:porphobilinogen synthase